jgi:peptidoglycan hydrolase-like protein with peptidoglycan-binding domain
VAAALAVGLTGCGMVSMERTSGAAAPGSVEAPSPPAAPEPPATTDASTPSVQPTTTAPEPVTPSTTTAPKPTTTSAPRPTTTTTTTPAPKPTTQTPTVKPTPTAGDTLQPGDSGAYVLAVQQRLSSLGYWLGTPDGTYGYLTSQAVMALQKSAGLGRDGVFGPATRRALEAGTRPQSRIGGTGIEIDLQRQVLLVVRGGAVTTILNTSTGSGQPFESYGQQHVAVTPRGTYSVFRVVDGNDEGPLGDLWRPRYFNGGIAVHGAGSVPGYPASHGCARVSNPAMDMIWARGLMPVGSRVTVY